MADTRLGQEYPRSLDQVRFFGDYATFGELISAYWPTLAAALAVSLVATPLCRAIAIKKNIVDRPDDWLKPHHKPIPYLGGVAIFLAWVAGLLVGMWWLGRQGVGDAQAPALCEFKTMITVLIGGTVVMALGLFDDLHMASPVFRLALTIAVALGLAVAGLGDDIAVSFLARMNVHFDPGEQWLVWLYSVPLTVFIVVGACNATNLLDGLDGLCGGVLGIISMGFLVLAAHVHTYSDWTPDSVQRMIICLAMLGAALGFLPFNRNPATIFMGDAGSMLLGFNAAILILMFAEIATFKWMLASVVVFGLPISDMVLTLVRRWRAQRPLMQGDRSHFYDQLRDRGYSVRKVVGISYTLAAVFALAGSVLPILLRTRYLVLAYMLLGVLVAALVKKYKMLRVDSPAADEPTQS